MQSLIEQYTQLLLRFGTPQHPMVRSFVNQHQGQPGFLNNVRQIRRAFNLQVNLAPRQTASAQNLANAFLLLANARVSPSGSVEAPDPPGGPGEGGEGGGGRGD